MILILGVTASGKSKLAFELAKSLGAEIISVDSMKIYRRMDIGTAKPPKQVQAKVKYHLIDVVEPSEPFNVGMFIELTNQAINQIKKRNKPVVAVGGTALYIKSLLYGIFEGPGTDHQIRNQLKEDAKNQGLAKLHEQLSKLDPQAALKIHPNDEKRIIRALEVHQLTGKPISNFQSQWTQDGSSISENWKIIGLRREKSLESQRINARVKEMIDKGLVDEVKSLLNEDKLLSKQAKAAIGYAEIIDHLNNKISLAQAIELIKKNTRHLAKHQRTWFKTFKNVNWIDIEPDESTEKIFERTKKLLENI